jgi:hypothetical protein
VSRTDPKSGYILTGHLRYNHRSKCITAKQQDLNMYSVCCENLKFYECTLHKMVYLLQTKNFSWKYFIKIHLLRMVLLDTQRKGKTEANTYIQTDTHTHIYALYETHPTFNTIFPLLCVLQCSWASTY